MRALIYFASLLLIAALCGCSSGGNIDSQIELARDGSPLAGDAASHNETAVPDFGFALPPLPQDSADDMPKNASAEVQIIREPNDTFARGPNATYDAIDDQLQLISGAGNDSQPWAWAMYQFGGFGPGEQPTLATPRIVASEDDDIKAWCAMSNYGKNRWEFFDIDIPEHGSDPFFIPTFSEDYTSEAGNVYVAYIVYGGEDNLVITESRVFSVPAAMPPSFIEASDGTHYNHIDVYWNISQNAEEYQLQYRSDAGPTEWTDLATIPEIINELPDFDHSKTAPPGRAAEHLINYQYRIRTKYLSGSLTGWTQPTTGFRFIGDVSLSASAFKPGIDGIELNVFARSGVDTFQWQRFDEVQPATFNGTSYVDSDVPSFFDVTYRVRAKMDDGTSGWSEEAFGYKLEWADLGGGGNTLYPDNLATDVSIIEAVRPMVVYEAPDGFLLASTYPPTPDSILDSSNTVLWNGGSTVDIIEVATAVTADGTPYVFFTYHDTVNDDYNLSMTYPLESPTMNGAQWTAPVELYKDRAETPYLDAAITSGGRPTFLVSWDDTVGTGDSLGLGIPASTDPGEELYLVSGLIVDDMRAFAVSGRDDTARLVYLNREEPKLLCFAVESGSGLSTYTIATGYDVVELDHTMINGRDAIAFITADNTLYYGWARVDDPVSEADWKIAEQGLKLPFTNLHLLHHSAMNRPLIIAKNTASREVLVSLSDELQVDNFTNWCTEFYDWKPGNAEDPAGRNEPLSATMLGSMPYIDNYTRNSGGANQNLWYAK